MSGSCTQETPMSAQKDAFQDFDVDLKKEKEPIAKAGGHDAHFVPSHENPESLRRLPKEQISRFEEVRNQLIETMKVEDDDDGEDDDSVLRPSSSYPPARDRTPANDSDWVTCSNDQSEIKNRLSTTNSRAPRMSKQPGAPLPAISAAFSASSRDQDEEEAV